MRSYLVDYGAIQFPDKILAAAYKLQLTRNSRIIHAVFHGLKAVWINLFSTSTRLSNPYHPIEKEMIDTLLWMCRVWTLNSDLSPMVSGHIQEMFLQSIGVMTLGEYV